MHLPQPASQAILQGAGFYRIRQRLGSLGDIFTIDAGVRAVVVGPRSDISQFSIYYFDPLAANRVNCAPLSIGTAFVGRVGARNATGIPNSNVGGGQLDGKLSIAPADIFDPDQLPSPADDVTVVRPIIDLIVYTSDPPAVPQSRPAIKFRSAMTVSAANGEGSLLFPVYGRREISVSCINRRAFGTDYELDIALFRLMMPVGAPAVQQRAVFFLVNGDTLNAQQQRHVTHNALQSTDPGFGHADYVFIRMLGPENVPSQQNIDGGLQVYVEAYD